MQATQTLANAQHANAHQPGLIDSTPALQEVMLSSESLLRGQKSVAIVHNGAIYRLQATKLGKLILTK